MPKPKIYQKSPLVIKASPCKYWWCACGLSISQPFCDGSHKSTEFNPVEIEITEEKNVAWCLCKHTGKKPFCDGKHKNL